MKRTTWLTIAFVFFAVLALALSIQTGPPFGTSIVRSLGLTDFFMEWNLELFWALYASFTACIIISLVLVREEERECGENI